MRKEILDQAHSYYLRGASIAKIAKHLNVSASNLRQNLILSGYKLKERKDVVINASDEELINLYESGSDLKTLAFKYRITEYLMGKRLSEAYANVKD